MADLRAAVGASRNRDFLGHFSLLSQMQSKPGDAVLTHLESVVKPAQVDLDRLNE